MINRAFKHTMSYKIRLAAKRCLLLLLVFACALPVTSCSDKGTEHTVSKEPLELSIFMHLWNSNGFKEDSAVFEEATRLTNIKLKGMVSSMTTNSRQAYDIMMASGQTADIIAYMSDDIEKSALDGAVIPLNKLIDDYAPNLKAYLQKNKDVLRAITNYDGNIYVIPKIMDGEVAKGWMIRKDWLDRLGLDVPQTVDEYYMVLKAFKEHDPNGNGVADEIPFFTRDTNTATTELLSLFGVKTGWGIKNGQVTYGEYSPEYKDAMKSIALWYKEGLIDKEIFSRAANAREALFERNIGGSTHDWFTSTMSFNSKMSDKVEGFELAAIAPPADIFGNVWEESSRQKLTGIGWAISSTNKHPVETIKYFDFWFGDTGRRLINYGVEGLNYDMIDGKPVFRAQMLQNDTPLPQLLSDYGIQSSIGFCQDFAYEEQAMDDNTRNAVKMYMENGYCTQAFPTLVLSPKEKNVYNEKYGSISSYVRETAKRWVLDNADIDAEFDGYIDTLRKMGMDEVIGAYKSAYMRYMSE